MKLNDSQGNVPKISLADDIAKNAKKAKIVSKEAEKNDEQEKPGAALGEPAPEGDNADNVPKILLIKRFLSKRYAFRYDEVGNEVFYRAKWEREWRELNSDNLLIELYEVGFNGIEKMLSALLRSDFVEKFNPFKAFFESLPEWKPGDPDYIEKMAGFVRAKDQDWFNLMYKKHLVRAVALALGQLKFNKHCFTIKGAQNGGKTSWVRFHMPEVLANYFTEHIDVNDKDGLFCLAENLIINLDELAQLSKFEINKIKAILTRHVVKERPPYGTKKIPFPRRATFFASTNDDEFLTDTTGNVRWLVFEVDEILHDNGGPNGYSQQVDINLVWAQALALLRSGYNYILSPDEIAKSERNNRTHQLLSIEAALIQECLAPANKSDASAQFMTAAQILTYLENETNTKQKLFHNNIGKAMSFLGFTKDQGYIREKGFQVKGYYVQKI
ncbi:MAG TPA: VapE family protein [Saprospiraceae bacterium]|nr:VapE family protein [Saprospiraceae bacterium]